MKDGWQLVKLNEVCNIINGRNQKLVESPDGEYPIYGSGGIMGYATDYLCEAGATIIGRKGSINNPIYVETRFWNVDTAFGLLPKPCMNSRLFHYFCLSFDFTKMNKGTTIPSLVKNDLLQIDVPYNPSISEQQRIVGILDAEFEKIDALKANAEKNLQNAKNLFQAALKKELEPKDEWKDTTISNVCSIFGRIGFRGYTTGDLVANADDGAITLSPSNITDNKMNYDRCSYISWRKYEESPEIKIYDGDILLVKTGSSYGKCALVDHLPHKATINPQFVVLKEIKINRHFLYYCLCTPYAKSCFDEFVSGTAIPTFSQKNLGQMKIAIPSKEEQLKIVSHLDELSNRCKQLQDNHTQTIALCDDLKQALLRKAFSGEL